MYVIMKGIFSIISAFVIAASVSQASELNILNSRPVEYREGGASDNEEIFSKSSAGFRPGLTSVFELEDVPTSDYWVSTSAQQLQWVSLASDAVGKYVVAGTYQNGVWFSKDSGLTWSKSSNLNDGTNWQYTVASDPTGQLVIAGSAALPENGYLFSSNDYGATFPISWSFGGGHGFVPNGLAMSASGVLIAAVSYAGVYMWRNAANLNSFDRADDLAENACCVSTDANFENVYIAYRSGTSQFVGIYYSIPDSTRGFGKAFHKSDAPNTLWTSLSSSSSGQYAVAATSANGVYFTNDYGRTWSLSSNSMNPSFQSISMSVSGKTAAAAANTNNNDKIYLSNNYGQTWIVSNSPSIQWSGTVVTDDGGLIYGCANAGGANGISGIYESNTAPTSQPTGQPTSHPSSPSSQPSTEPSSQPSFYPSSVPSIQPSFWPTEQPTMQPSIQPSAQPSMQPIRLPTRQPSVEPSTQPVGLPTCKPSLQPTTQPSRLPSNQPTSTPTCILGHGSNDGGSNCNPCPAGWFAPQNPQNEPCLICSAGKYSSNVGSSDCNQCKYPYTNNQKGSTGCSMYMIALAGVDPLVADSSLYGFIGFILLILLVFIWLSVRDINKLTVIFFLLLFPTLDVLSDLLYLSTNLFYNSALFYVCLTVLIFSSAGLLTRLYELKAWPQKFIVPFPVFYFNPNLIWFTVKDSTLLVNNAPALPFPIYDSIIIWTVVIVLFLFLCVCQLLTFAVYLLWVVVHIIVVYPLMLLVAFFLYQTKLFSLSLVWNYWFFLWTGAMKYKKDVIFDKRLFNEALFQEFLSETLPQLAIQTLNNVLIGQFSTIALVSVMLSSIIAVDGVYQFLYYRLYLKTSFEDVPLMFNLNVASDSFDRSNKSISGNMMMMKDMTNQASGSSSINAPHMKLQPVDLDLGSKSKIELESDLIRLSLFDDYEYQLLLLLMWLQFNANLNHIDASIVMERLKKHSISNMLKLFESYYNGTLMNFNINRTNLSLIISTIEDELEKDRDVVSIASVSVNEG